MLKLKNITKIFNKDLNKEDIKIALNDVSLNVNKGDFITVIGSNGSGKSTLFNIISGAYSPDLGSVIIDNLDVTKEREHKRAKHIGIVFQDPLLGTAANMSVLENLILAKNRTEKKTLAWAFKSEDNIYFKEQLKLLNLGLEDRLNNKIGLLSGGQRQAITLLMATLKNPILLLLDEHTAALDPKTAKIVLDITNKLVKDNNLTTIMVTHNMSDALKYGNRLLMLKEGNIVLDISGKEKEEMKIEQLVKLFY